MSHPEFRVDSTKANLLGGASKTPPSFNRAWCREISVAYAKRVSIPGGAFHSRNPRSRRGLLLFEQRTHQVECVWTRFVEEPTHLHSKTVNAGQIQRARRKH